VSKVSVATFATEVLCEAYIEVEEILVNKRRSEWSECNPYDPNPRANDAVCAVGFKRPAWLQSAAEGYAETVERAREKIVCSDRAQQLCKGARKAEDCLRGPARLERVEHTNDHARLPAAAIRATPEGIHEWRDTLSDRAQLVEIWARWERVCAQVINVSRGADDRIEKRVRDS
jgi:hypothetical protein